MKSKSSLHCTEYNHTFIMLASQNVWPTWNQNPGLENKTGGYRMCIGWDFWAQRLAHGELDKYFFVILYDVSIIMQRAICKFT